MSRSLGSIFTSGVANKIEVLYDEVKNSGLVDPVGTSAFQLKEVSVSADKGDLKIFDVAASLGAEASALVSINASTATVAPFDSTKQLAAPAGTSYAQLHIEGKLSGNAGGAISTIPLSLSAGATASFEYDHYLPVSATEIRSIALAQLITSAQLPQFENLATLANGEISTFQAALNVDLGLSGTFGKSFDIDDTLKLFDGLSGQFKAKVRYSIQASLGWSLFENMDLTVARAQTAKDGWVRVRFDRSRKDTFTAGATFALQVDYDASSIGDALEKAFEASPLQRAIDILTKVKDTTWDDVKTQVSDRASTELISLIAGTGWKEKAANSPEVTEALAAINKVIGIYNSIDPKVQQLWSSLLLKADLNPGSSLRTTIDRIAALNPDDPNLQQFLSTSAQKDIDMLESLSGKSLEQLLVGSSTAVRAAIVKAVDLAKQLESIINDTPQKITGALDQFAQTSGIKSIITWLSKNATSLNAIQQSGDAAIQNVVEKAVGKLLGSTTPKDIQAVQNWATRILAKWDELSAKLAAAAKFLKGTVGFNVSLEYSRVSEASAVLDFELDPSNAAAVKAVRSELPTGSVRDMLSALDDIKPDDTGALPYTINECVLITRQTRTGARTVILSLLGLQNLQKITTARFTDSTVRVSNTGREATFGGGLLQSTQADNASSECGVWMSIDASSNVRNLDAPFDQPARSLRLTFARKDKSADQEELGALQNLLIDLGFFQGAAATLSAPNNSEISFTLDITLGEEAVKVFATDDGEDNWNKDYRNAAYRLLRDDMLTRRLQPFNEPIGEVMAAVVKDDRFGTSWTDTSLQNFISVARNPGFALNGRPIPIVNEQNTIVPPYLTLQMLIIRRPKGLDELAQLASAIQNNGKRQGDLEKDTAITASLFGDVTLADWDNPMFNFWFVIARLTRLAKTTNVLQKATGFATFRSRTSSTSDFSAPAQWTLMKDVGVSVSTIAGRQLFPFG